MVAFRTSLLSIAGRPEVEQFVRGNARMSGMVSRFVAGDDLASAMRAATKLSRLGITSTLDQLGENVRNEQEAFEAADSYSETLRQMAGAGLDPNISIKLTMIGLDLSESVTAQNLTRILEAAEICSGFVRIDMEGSAYTARTMRMFEEAHNRFPNNVGIVIQSYLHRARADVERCIGRNARVRLVKGAYSEPANVALQRPEDIDDNFRRLAELLLTSGSYPAIATHDPALISFTREYANANWITSEKFEFQMLFGVRRDEQTSLVADGYRMRVYVPYGTEWYPYFTRRIAERPANAYFVLRQLVG